MRQASSSNPLRAYGMVPLDYVSSRKVTKFERQAVPTANGQMFPVQVRRLLSFGFDYNYHGPPTLVVRSDFAWYRVRSASINYEYHWRSLNSSTDLVNCVLTRLSDAPDSLEWRDILDRVNLCLIRSSAGDVEGRKVAEDLIMHHATDLAHHLLHQRMEKTPFYMQLCIKMGKPFDKRGQTASKLANQDVASDARQREPVTSEDSRPNPSAATAVSSPVEDKFSSLSSLEKLAQILTGVPEIIKPSMGFAEAEVTIGQKVTAAPISTEDLPPSTAGESSNQKIEQAAREPVQATKLSPTVQKSLASPAQPPPRCTVENRSTASQADEACLASTVSIIRTPASALSTEHMRQTSGLGEPIKPHIVRDSGIRQHFSDHPRTIIAKLPLLPQIFTQGWFECPYSACQFILERPHAYNFIREIRTHLKVHRMALQGIGKPQQHRQKTEVLRFNLAAAVEQSARLKPGVKLKWPGLDAITQIRDRAHAWQTFQTRQLKRPAAFDGIELGGPAKKILRLAQIADNSSFQTVGANSGPDSASTTPPPSISTLVDSRSKSVESIYDAAAHTQAPTALMEHLRPKTSSALMAMTLKKKKS